MTVHPANRCLVVAVHSRKELDAALDKAVDFLKPAAITDQVGVSVTRLTPCRYEVCLDSDVSPGMTIERWGRGLR